MSDHKHGTPADPHGCMADWTCEAHTYAGPPPCPNCIPLVAAPKRAYRTVYRWNHRMQGWYPNGVAGPRR